MKVLLSLAVLSLTLAFCHGVCVQTMLIGDYINGLLLEPDGCDDIYDNVKHPFGTTWDTDRCMRCSCGLHGMECCTRYPDIENVPGCIAVFNQDTCRYTFFELDNPAVPCGPSRETV